MYVICKLPVHVARAVDVTYLMFRAPFVAPSRNQNPQADRLLRSTASIRAAHLWGGFAQLNFYGLTNPTILRRRTAQPQRATYMS